MSHAVVVWCAERDALKTELGSSEEGLSRTIGVLPAVLDIQGLRQISIIYPLMLYAQVRETIGISMFLLFSSIYCYKQFNRALSSSNSQMCQE